MRTNLIITDVKSYLIPEDPQIDGWCKLRPNIIVRIETESGLSGWGECYVSAGHENAICSLVDSLGRSLLGKDASNIRAFTNMRWQTSVINLLVWTSRAQQVE